MKIVNIAAYKFVELDQLPLLRAKFKQECHALDMRGTILLSEEGINLTVAGLVASIEAFKAWLAQDVRFANMPIKESLSTHKPFNRMLVKIKKEIIAFGLPNINPARRPAPRISAATLKQWLDEQRDVLLLDARNHYEVRLGTFKNAQELNIAHFRHFPQAAQQLNNTLKQKPIVTLCTGGIRCEKAAPLLQQYGFKNVFQLEGGILNYFKECGAAHYEGECFVFDRRVAVDAKLEETGTVQCFVCLQPVSMEAQRSPDYIPDVSCPNCRIKQRPLES